ncbi:MAG: tRNA lysidine(34) synthetase TilS [Alphaproteobacteria bacterium]|nr:tRNA lysidine(34) synthetase TilS [Alphaproteobacteria bacterium]
MSAAGPDAAPGGLDEHLHAALAGALATVRGPVALGLSGGGDSVALLAAARGAAPDRPLVAIIVDHALRDGSAEDAARAVAIARALGADPVVRRLAWPGAPPRTQAAARGARYAAFADEMRRRDATALLLGHTADDQAETVLIRAGAASGVYGRAGMTPDAPLPLWPEGRGLRVLRPLLAIRRAALRAWLRAAGLSWLDDPANLDARFARVRVRADLAALDAAAFEAVCAAAAAAAESAAALDTAAAAALAGLEVGLQGEIAVPAAGVERLDEAARRRAFAALVAAGAGRADPPSGAGLARLAALGWASAALGGALFTRSPGVPGGRILVRRDPGSVLGRGARARAAPIPLDPGRPIMFDGRLFLEAATAGLAIAPGPGARAGVKLAVLTPAGRLGLEEAAAAGLVRVTPLARDMVAHVLWRSHGAASGQSSPKCDPQSDI